MSTTEQQSTNAALVIERLPTPAHLIQQLLQKIYMFDIGDLHWTKRAVTVGANKGGTVQEACIATDRLNDFIAGTLPVWQLSAGVQQATL